MAGYDSLAQRYDLNPETLDRLNSIGGYDQAPPMDPGTAVDRGAGLGIAGNALDAAVQSGGSPSAIYNALSATPKPADLPAGPARAPAPAPEPPPDPAAVNAQAQAMKAGALANVNVDPEAARGGINPTEQQGQMGASGGGGGSPGFVGWMPSSRQVQRKEGYSQDELAPLRDIGTDRLGQTTGRLQAEMELANQKGAVDAAYEQAYAQQAEKFAQHQQFLANERTAYVEDERRKLNELAVQTQKEVDPDKYMNELGPGGSILAALMVGMGQFGASLSGGQNAALQIMNANIDRNIRAQEHNIAQAGKAYNTRENLLARNMEAFGDRDKAITATRINYLDAVKSKLEAAMADKSRPIQKRQRAHAMLEKVNEHRYALEDNFTKLAHAEVTAAQSDRFVVQQGGGGGAAKSLENTVQMPDGTVVQLDNGAQANDVSKTLGYHGEMQALHKEALGLRNQLEKLDPVTDRVKYQSLYRELQLAQKSASEAASQAAGQGVITKEDAKRDAEVGLNYTQGFGGNMVSGTIQKHLNPGAKGEKTIGDNTINAAIKQSNIQSYALVRAHRGRIVKGQYVKGSDGELKPKDSYTGQDPKPVEQRAPDGFVPKNPDARVPTRGPTLAESTPKAPVVAGPAGAAASPFAGLSEPARVKHGGGRRRK